MTDWTIGVEGFGRIARADVEVKPLTVFVGSNNSGKSYLASLVWGVEHGGLRDIGAGGHELPPTLTSWLSSARAVKGEWIPAPADLQPQIRQLWPALVDAHTPELCLRLFDTEGIQPRRLGVGAPPFARSWYARITEQTDTSSGDHEIATFCTDPEHGDDHSTIRFVDMMQHPDDLGRLVSHMIGLGQRNDLSSEYESEDPIFLPAARTGFSLFLPTFLQSRLSATLTQSPSVRTRNSRRTTSIARFTLPQMHLLSALTTAFGGTPGPYADEAERLERQCLEGSISARAETGAARYAFRPRGTDADLGLQVTSALVTELMPLVMALRNAQRIPFLVLEEPEAHLHPRLVRAVIRCLGRLVRRGVRVLITTHSATVAQQVNNLVKLGALDPEARAEQQARFGYGESEYLLPSEVGVHEFRFRDDDRTFVERIEPGPVGFPMPTFNEALQAFAAETLALNERLDPEPEG